MPRFLPRSTHICHICATSFEVCNEFDLQSQRLIKSPDVCPACTAPLKPCYPIQLGNVKDLVLTYYRLSAYRTMFGTPQQFLEQRCRDEAELDRYIELVRSLDVDGWQHSDAHMRADDRPSREGRAEAAAIARVRAGLQSGTLLRGLRRIAESVRAALRQEREHYLQIYAQQQRDQPRA